MSDVGIRLSMTENVSSLAPKVSSALREVSDQGEEMRTALDLGDLEEKYKSFADRVDRLYDTQRAMRQQREEETRRGEGQQQRVRAGDRSAAALLQRRRDGGAAGVEDVEGEGGGLAGGLGAAITAIKSPVMIAVLALVGIGKLVNDLIKSYEEAIPTTMDLTASLGRLGETSEESAKAFRDTFDEVSKASNEYAYTLEQGAAIFKGLAAAGKVPTEEEAQDVMRYARGLGVSPDVLTRFLGTGRRFGMEGNLVGLAAGGLEAAGMGEARFEEFLSGTMSVFEKGLSKGIVRGFEDILQAQVWLAGAGEAYRGQAGLTAMQQLGGAAVGATALQREQDVLLFRAASNIVGRMSEGERKEMGLEPGYVGIMQYLERGITPQLFEETTAMVKEMAASRVDLIEMLRETFEISYQRTVDLLAVKPSPEFEEKKPPEVRGTPEMQAIILGLELQTLLRTAGREALPVKIGMLEAAEGVLGKILDFYFAEMPEAKPTLHPAAAGFPAVLQEPSRVGITVSDVMTVGTMYVDQASLPPAIQAFLEDVSADYSRAAEVPEWAREMIEAAKSLEGAAKDLDKSVVEDKNVNIIIESLPAMPAGFEGLEED